MKLVLVNELLADKDFQKIIRAVKAKLPEAIARFPELNITSITGETWLDPKNLYKPTGKDFVVYLSERHSVTGDAGFHDFITNADGTRYPVAWCSLKNSGSIFGKFHYPIITLAHKVGLLSIPTRQVGVFKIWSHGLATVAMHELIEALGNPWLDKFSGTVPGTTLDANGHAIFFEVCDPVAKNWDLWTDPVTKQDIACPSFVFADWYNLNAKPGVPVCSDGSVTKPWQVAKGGYDFWKTKLGKWLRA